MLCHQFQFLDFQLAIERLGASDVHSKIYFFFLVDKPAGDGRVTVDAAIAQKRPVAANIFKRLKVDFADQDFLAVVGGFGQHAAEGIAEERSAPEFQTLAGSRLSADVAGFEADAIHNGDLNSVGNGVRALNGAP